MRRVGKAKRAHVPIGIRQRCARTRPRRAFARFCAPSARRREILHDLQLARKPKASPRVLSCRGNEHRVRNMKEELTTILEAMRAAQGELADYLVSADRNAELTIAKLVGILERREVIRAMRLLRASEAVGAAPQPMLAEAS